MSDRSAGGALLNRAGAIAVASADVSRNLAARAGGRIALSGGTVAVADCLLDDNSAAYGGGVHVASGTVTLGGDRGSHVTSNRAGA